MTPPSAATSSREAQSKTAAVLDATLAARAVTRCYTKTVTSGAVSKNHHHLSHSPYTCLSAVSPLSKGAERCSACSVAAVHIDLLSKRVADLLEENKAQAEAAVRDCQAAEGRAETLAQQIRELERHSSAALDDSEARRLAAEKLGQERLEAAEVLEARLQKAEEEQRELIEACNSALADGLEELKTVKHVALEDSRAQHAAIAKLRELHELDESTISRLQDELQRERRRADEREQRQSAISPHVSAFAPVGSAHKVIEGQNLPSSRDAKSAHEEEVARLKKQLDASIKAAEDKVEHEISKSAELYMRFGAALTRIAELEQELAAERSQRAQERESYRRQIQAANRESQDLLRRIASLDLPSRTVSPTAHMRVALPRLNPD